MCKKANRCNIIRRDSTVVIPSLNAKARERAGKTFIFLGLGFWPPEGGGSGQLGGPIAATVMDKRPRPALALRAVA
jgi:hypothetical protein